MRGALAASTSSRGASVSTSSTRPTARGAAGGCSSSGRELPSLSISQRRCRFNRSRRILSSVPPPSYAAAAADGAFSAGGQGGEEDDDIADPFALADEDIPAEVAAQFASASVGGGGGGDNGGDFASASTPTTSTIDDEQFEGGSGKVRAFSRVNEKDPYR